MAEEKSAREMIFETNRDVKWICRTLQRMEKQDCDFENRLRRLEGWKQEKIGDDRRKQGISAGIGASAGGVAALLVKLFG